MATIHLTMLRCAQHHLKRMDYPSTNYDGKTWWDELF